MLDLTKPVQTRDGRKVRILCTDRKNPIDGSVVGLVTDNFGEEWVGSWTLDGKAWPARTGASEADLVNAVEKRFLRVYWNTSAQKMSVGILSTEQDSIPPLPPTEMIATLELSVQGKQIVDVVIHKK